MLSADSQSPSPASDAPVASGAQLLAQADFGATTTKARLHLPYLDGIRALMALYVLHNHLLSDIGLAHTKFSLRPGEVLQMFYLGHYAVAVFIVLSGYCLMLPVLRDGGTLRGGLSLFFRRRARRILPPYYAALAGAAALLFVAARLRFHLPPAPELLSPASWALHLSVLHNLSSRHIYDFNGALWSIATECQIYLLFPLVFLPIWKWRGEGALAIAGAALGALFTFGFPSIVRACPWFIALFAWGMIAAKWSLAPSPAARRFPWVWLGVALSMATYLLVRTVPGLGWAAAFKDAGPGWYLLPDIALGCATFCFLMHGTLTTLDGRASKFLKVLTWRPLVFIGAFSYSLYLVHMPVLLVAASLVKHFQLPRAASYGALLACVPFIVALSYGFFLLFEKPFLGAPKPKTRARS